MSFTLIRRLACASRLAMQRRAHGTSLGGAFAGCTLMLAVGLFMAGCGGEAPDSAPPPSGAGASQDVSRHAPVAPTQVQPQTLQVPQGADPSMVLAEMNRELKRWIVRNRRVPANFEEFVASSQMQVPPPPAGKKYTLTREMKIELTKR